MCSCLCQVCCPPGSLHVGGRRDVGQEPRAKQAHSSSNDSRAACTSQGTPKTSPRCHRRKQQHSQLPKNQPVLSPLTCTQARAPGHWRAILIGPGSVTPSRSVTSRPCTPPPPPLPQGGRAHPATCAPLIRRWPATHPPKHAARLCTPSDENGCRSNLPARLCRRA